MVSCYLQQDQAGDGWVDVLVVGHFGYPHTHPRLVAVRPDKQHFRSKFQCFTVKVTFRHQGRVHYNVPMLGYMGGARRTHPSERTKRIWARRGGISPFEWHFAPFGLAIKTQANVGGIKTRKGKKDARAPPQRAQRRARGARGCAHAGGVGGRRPADRWRGGGAPGGGADRGSRRAQGGRGPRARARGAARRGWGGEERTGAGECARLFVRRAGRRDSAARRR